MKRILSFCLLLLCLVIISNCKKLPPETSKGKNFIACMVDGEVFKSKFKGAWFFGPVYGTSAIYWPAGKDFQIYIAGSRKYRNGEEASISVSLKDYTGIGKYSLKAGIGNEASFYYNEKIGKNEFEGFHFNNHHPASDGWIDIKVFTDSIIAGTFEFTAMDDEGEGVDITKGRFDIEYQVKE